MTSLALSDARETMTYLSALEKTGAMTATSLDLSDPDLPYERWESLGRFLGTIDRACRWWIGDWLNFGEALYGEEAAQAVEATTAERYDEAERVTGLERGVLMNISSVCRRIARSRRRPELGFWIHAEVAALDPDDQTEWLDHAVQAGLTQSALRRAIREARKTGTGPTPDPPPEFGESFTFTERVEHAARQVLTTMQPTPEGMFVVPPEPIALLRAALGGD